MAVPSGRTILRYKIHWHVVFTHFPIAFFVTSALFMLLHEFTDSSCFELAGLISLIFGTVVMIPTTLTGWFTWKGAYKGAHGQIFTYKSRIAYAMIFLSILASVWQIAFPAESHTIWHRIYTACIVLLLIGAGAEGFYGGRLNHR